MPFCAGMSQNHHHWEGQEKGQEKAVQDRGLLFLVRVELIAFEPAGCDR